MIIVTPVNEHFTRCNQDCDELQALLSDLGTNSRDYLAHADAMVRCYADWTMHYYGIRRFRREAQGEVECRTWGRKELDKLYRRLRLLAALPVALVETGYAFQEGAERGVWTE